MELNLPGNASKETAFKTVEAWLNSLALEIAEIDNQRPWGGFFLLSNESTDLFIRAFFSEVNTADLYKYGTELSPKILLVEPAQRLSWQYHNRRAELWKAVRGPVGVMTSNDDTPPEVHEILESNEMIEHGNQVRHRLIGLDNWGVVAEIWQHTVNGQPSDEEDIIRVEDSYGRR